MDNIDISTGEYAAQWSLTDFYDDCKNALAKALASGKDFHTEWGCKKEIHYCDLVKKSGWIRITVTCNTDDITDSDDLIFDAASDANIDEEKLTDEVLSQIHDAVFDEGLGDSSVRVSEISDSSSIDDVIKEIDRLEDEAMNTNNQMYERLKDIVFYAAQ